MQEASLRFKSKAEQVGTQADARHGYCAQRRCMGPGDGEKAWPSPQMKRLNVTKLKAVIEVPVDNEQQRMSQSRA